MNADNLTQEQAAVLGRKLNNDGMVVIFACCQVSGAPWLAGGKSRASKMLEMANKIGKPVIANTSYTYGNGKGDGDWYKFIPSQ